MSRYTRSLSEDHDDAVSALVKLDMALAAREGPPLEGQFGPHPLPRLLDELLTAAHGARSSRFSAILDHMILGHIPPEIIVDVYLPETARLLGQAWIADELRFVDVTIATSRLQSALHRFDSIWQAHEPMGQRPACLMTSRLDAQHTLGPTLLASQMRRRGISVELALGVGQDQLVTLIEKRHYNAVFISATGCDDLEALQELVRRVRIAKSSVPVVIGGSFFDDFPECRDQTGADLVTSDLVEALEFCGIQDQNLRASDRASNNAFSPIMGDAETRPS